MSNVQIRKSLPPLSEADVVKVEKQLGISLPEEYRNFLLAHNGGRPTPNIFPITGDPADTHGILNNFLCVQEGKYDSLLNYAQVYRKRVPANLLPIAEDPGGNLITLAVAGPDRGKVYFWDHEEEYEEGETPGYDNIYFIANSFNDLLNNLNELPTE